MDYDEKSDAYICKMGNSCHLHMSDVLNLKPDMSVKKAFINVRNVKIALTRKNVSKGTTVKHQ